MDFQLMSKPITVQIMELREQIRKINYEIQLEQVQRRRTTIILTSTERYGSEKMLKALDDYASSIKKIIKSENKLKSKFEKLYLLNFEYKEVEVLTR